MVDFVLSLNTHFETDTETLGRWPQSLRPALRPPWSQSQSRDQSLTHLLPQNIPMCALLKPILTEVQSF